MPLTVPTLDDRTYRDLVEEGLRLVAAGDGEWTNRNPSDPGVTLLELLAYFSEMLIYRVNQFGDDDLRAFARLLSPAVTAADLSAADQLVAAVKAARRRERVVSCADFEDAAAAVDPRIARAYCVPDRDLTQGTAATRHAVRPGHVSVLLVPRASVDPAEMAALCEAVLGDLEPRRLLTTRVHVGTAERVDLGVRLSVVTTPDASVAAVRERIRSALADFLDPATGGTRGQGWPLGRSVFVSELYQLLDRLPGVDYVTRTVDPQTGLPQDELQVTTEAGLRRNDYGELVALDLEPHQIVHPSAKDHVLDVRSRHHSTGAEN